MFVQISNNNVKCTKCGYDFKIGETHRVIEYDDDNTEIVYFRCPTFKCTEKIKVSEKDHEVFL